MRLLFCALVLCFSTTASADWCGRVGREEDGSDPVTKTMRVGDVIAPAGSRIEWVARVTDQCVVLGREIGIVRLPKGGEVCGAQLPSGTAVQLQYPLAAVDAALPARRLVLIHAAPGATIVVGSVTVIADHATLSCGTGAAVVTGRLAKPATVFGTKLYEGDYFQGESNCFSWLELKRTTRVGPHLFPGSSRIRFENCRPDIVQMLGGRSAELTHDGITCLLDAQVYMLGIHPTTGKIASCQKHRPFDTVIDGVRRRVIADARFHPDGTLSEGKLADDRFFGADVTMPSVEVDSSGHLKRVMGRIANDHVFAGVACRPGTVILDGGGTPTQCER